MTRPLNANEPHLLFVYNADSGLGQAIFDAVHKIVSPQTYPCSLCALTYGAVSMKAEWKAALATLPLPARFLHRDEFTREWPALDVALPAVITVENSTATVLLDGPALDQLADISALVTAINREVGGRNHHVTQISD